MVKDGESALVREKKKIRNGTAGTRFLRTLTILIFLLVEDCLFHEFLVEAVLPPLRPEKLVIVVS